MSRAYVYRQNSEVEKYIQELEIEQDNVAVLKLTKELYKRAILSLSLDGRATTEGIQRFFESVFEIQISVGYISGVIKEACERAQKFDDSIDLSGISQGANDEIFQGSKPILTGIDPESTYIYLLEEAKDRSAETWETYMEDRKDHGLKLNVTINDKGSGLMAGIPRAFKEIEIQPDSFHALYPIGKEITKIERKAYSMIGEESELKRSVHGTRPRQKTKEKLEQIQPKVAEVIDIYDRLKILFCWLSELLGFSGYNLEDTYKLLEYVLDEMEKVTNQYPILLKEIKTLRTNLPSQLSFINRLYKEMDVHAQKQGIPPEAFLMMYQQRTYGQKSEAYQKIEYQLVMLLMYDYDLAREKFKNVLNSVKKASSLVENLNSRIRVYMDIKRDVPTNFFVLMKVYFNTRAYKRSRCKERVGKSPLELLTGKEQLDFYTALGYSN